MKIARTSVSSFPPEISLKYIDSWMCVYDVIGCHLVHGGKNTLLFKF